MEKKRLKELTIKDSFLFGAVMTDSENCKGFLEMVLGISIDHVVVSKEKSIIYHPEYKGVRLDVYAKDEKNVHYNVEMQVLKKPALGKRSRYYQSQMDMELLLSGEDYSELPDTYVIFICDFDPFDRGRYRYTFRTKCEEDETVEVKDGRYNLFLSTCGKNEQEVSKELVTFLKFVKADLPKSQEDFHDPYVERLQRFIQNLKENREVEEHFMLFEEMLRDERAEGKAEGIAEGMEKGRLEGRHETLLQFLGELGQVPENLKEQILKQTDEKTLENWIKLAVTSESLETFIQAIQ